VPIKILYDLIHQIHSIDKITIFYLIRGFIGLFSAYGKAKFVYSIQTIYGVGMMKLMTIFLCFAPGMFYCSQHIYHQQQQ